MTQHPPVSVVIVSRGRPETLKLCLIGVARLVYTPFQIVVVADTAGIAALGDLPFASDLITVEFNTPNISLARNLGVTHAGGDILAFIDDDAVPEPLWLYHLTAPFSDPNTAATGGFVRGRNGISFQWKARAVNALGQTRDVTLNHANQPDLLPNEATKLEGTNMAFRRETLAGIGGFDPVFKFYKDETDLCFRLMQAGHKTQLTPLAEVHHAYAPSPRRHANRAVRDLTEIGASSALFLRKHAPEQDWSAREIAMRAEQETRLNAQAKVGILKRADIAHLLQTYDDGCTQGAAQAIKPLKPLPAKPDFAPFPIRATGQHHVLSGRIWSARRLKNQAAQLAAQGHTVSLYLFTHTALFHSVRFQPQGYWKQRGGLFGRSDRDQPVFRLTHLRARTTVEIARTAAQRGQSL